MPFFAPATLAIALFETIPGQVFYNPRLIGRTYILSIPFGVCFHLCAFPSGEILTMSWYKVKILKE